MSLNLFRWVALQTSWKMAVAGVEPSATYLRALPWRGSAEYDRTTGKTHFLFLLKFPEFEGDLP